MDDSAFRGLDSALRIQDPDLPPGCKGIKILRNRLVCDDRVYVFESVKQVVGRPFEFRMIHYQIFLLCTSEHLAPDIGLADVVVREPVLHTQLRAADESLVCIVMAQRFDGIGIGKGHGTSSENAADADNVDARVNLTEEIADRERIRDKGQVHLPK